MHWSYCDHEGSAPEARPSLHIGGWPLRVSHACAGWHGVKFLLVGQTCVRARGPSKMKPEKIQTNIKTLRSMWRLGVIVVSTSDFVSKFRLENRRFGGYRSFHRFRSDDLTFCGSNMFPVTFNSISNGFRSKDQMVGGSGLSVCLCSYRVVS